MTPPVPSNPSGVDPVGATDFAGEASAHPQGPHAGYAPAQPTVASHGSAPPGPQQGWQPQQGSMPPAPQQGWQQQQGSMPPGQQQGWQQQQGSMPPGPQQGWQQGQQPGWQQQGPHGQAVAKPAGSAAGVVGIVLALLAVPPLGLALHNLWQAQRLALDLKLPVFARGIVADANLGRVLLFGGVALALGLFATILGAVGRRAGAGKAAIALGAIALVASLYAQAGRATFDRKFPPGKYEEEERLAKRAEEEREEKQASKTKDSDNAPATVVEGPIQNPTQGSFRLGRKVALAALGRARGAGAAGDRVFEKAQIISKDLAVTLPALPVLSGDKAKDSAEALHYLLDTVGKPVAVSLRGKHGAQASAAFELGLKMTLINLLYLPNDSIGQSLGTACTNLSGPAGLKSGTLVPLVSKIRANASQDQVGRATETAAAAVDAELGALPPPEKPKPRPMNQRDLNRQLF